MVFLSNLKDEALVEASMRLPAEKREEFLAVLKEWRNDATIHLEFV